MRVRLLTLRIDHQLFFLITRNFQAHDRNTI